MFKVVRDNVLVPLATRVGTFFGTILLGAGANADLVEQVILGTIAVILIAWDLLLSKVRIEREKEKAVSNVQ